VEGGPLLLGTDAAAAGAGPGPEDGLGPEEPELEAPPPGPDCEATGAVRLAFARRVLCTTRRSIWVRTSTDAALGAVGDALVGWLAIA
jgi:hypothetical protein